MQLDERIEAMAELGRRMTPDNKDLDTAIRKAYRENRWFVPEHSRLAANAIREEFLSEQKLSDWVFRYQLENISPKIIGLVPAGNVPLVGFHDLLAVFIAGHIAQIKLSEKDKALMQFVIQTLYEINPKIKDRIHIVERLQDFDAVIATGSDNTARYFHSYFGKYPHIIRHNRNSVAVLSGKETREEHLALGKDIFTYFGLGCRNVSKIYVPKAYNFEPLLNDLHEYRDIVLNDKYKNNIDYAFALYIMNKEFYMNNGCIILHEARPLASRIGTLHYEFYDDSAHLHQLLEAEKDKIQVVVSQKPINGFVHVPFGKTQMPSLTDYPDGVDVMEFLQNLQ